MFIRSGVIRILSTILAVVVALVVVLPNALAFERSRTEYGAPLRLTPLPARVRLDNPVPGLSDGGHAALLRAIASWNAEACLSPVLVLTDDDDDVMIEIVTVVDQWKFGSAIAAHTAVDSEPYRGDIRHVVIEMDGRRTFAQGDGIAADAIDIESVFLHELGHALGLDHSRNQDAVMRAGLKTGQTRRLLHEDDRAGVCLSTGGKTFGWENALRNAKPMLQQVPQFFLLVFLFVVGTGVVLSTLFKRAMAQFAPRRRR